MTLRGKVILITGASRGIGRAIALRVAKDGACVAIVAKSAEQQAKLPGTIYSVAEEVENAGGKALPIVCDIRFEEQIINAVNKTVEKFGGIDVLVNNASAISLTPTEKTSSSRFDLMHQINTRGTFLVSKHCLPHLKKANNPHILNISPPLSMKQEWFAPHVAYTIAKYGMSLCVLGMAGEYRDYGVAVNALWPKTIIDTAALQAISAGDGGKSLGSKGRTPEIMADAAYVILTQPSRSYSGHFTVDEGVLRSVGVKNFDKYSAVPGNKDFLPDFFLEDDYTFQGPGKHSMTSASSDSSRFKSSAETVDTLAIPGFKASLIFQQFATSLHAMNANQRQAYVQRVKSIFEFDIKKEGSGKVRTWTVDLKNGTGTIFLGQSKGDTNSNKADIIFSISDDDFAELAEGRLSGQQAFLTGKLKIKGNMILATTLESLMKKLKQGGGSSSKL